MKNILICGTNGMIGSSILDICLQRGDINMVTSITRKPLGFSHPKLIEVIHTDFLDYSAIEPYFQNQDTCFYCLGVYTGQVSKDDFRMITVDYTIAFASMVKKCNPALRFCFLSGNGADLTEKSKLMFARDKGAAENGLLNLRFQYLNIFRPGYIYPEKPRKEPNLPYKVFRVLYKPLLSKVYPNIGLSSSKLAKAMVTIGLFGGDKVFYENRDIREINS